MCIRDSDSGTYVLPRIGSKKIFICLVRITVPWQYCYSTVTGYSAVGRTYNTPQTIFSKFKTPYFFLNIRLRCCLCNSSFIWAKVRSGQRCSLSANLNLLYHLLFLILPHNCCIVMVVLYVGAIELVVGGYIQYERVTRIVEGEWRSHLSLLTAVSTHEEHHFPVYYEGVTLHPSHIIASSQSSSLFTLV